MLLQIRDCESSKFNRIINVRLIIRLNYFTLTLVLTSSTNVLAGLKEGML